MRMYIDGQSGSMQARLRRKQDLNEDHGCRDVSTLLASPAIRVPRFRWTPGPGVCLLVCPQHGGTDAKPLASTYRGRTAVPQDSSVIERRPSPRQNGHALGLVRMG